MSDKRTSLFENGLIWFGAAISIAEILTGTYFAPLGFTKGITAIIIGHLIGCLLLFLAGVIGGKSRKSSMETVKTSFGSRGSALFILLNIIQLLGWTAIMIFDGAVAANGIWGIGQSVWALAIGMLIIVWVAIGVENLGKINVVVMSALFILTVIMSFVVFTSGDGMEAAGEAMSFGAAVELSVAMPLSWLPLISDYTMKAEKTVKASAVSAATYGVISCWMYIIGMAAAIFAAESDIAKIILKTGFGVVGLIVVVLSTVTTTFLDAYSAGVSAESITMKIKLKWMAIATTVIGTAGAIFIPLHDITDFLYFIGSVFAPMTAVLLADFFVIKNDSSESKLNIGNLVVWLVGFILYRVLMRFDIIIGNTLPDMTVTFVLAIIVNKLRGKKHEK